MSPGALALGEGDSTLLYVAEGHAVSAFDAGTLAFRFRFGRDAGTTPRGGAGTVGKTRRARAGELEPAPACAGAQNQQQHERQSRRREPFSALLEEPTVGPLATAVGAQPASRVTSPCREREQLASFCGGSSLRKSTGKIKLSPRLVLFL